MTMGHAFVNLIRNILRVILTADFIGCEYNNDAVIALTMWT